MISALAFIFLTFFISTQILFDIQDIKHSRFLRRELATFKKQKQQTFSVLIEANDQAEQSISLIEHLESHNYPKLEIICITKQASIKKQLDNYQKINKTKHLRTIRFTGGMKITNLIKRHSSGNLVLILRSNDRLSSNFFNIASIEVLQNNRVAAFLPLHQIRIDKTVGSLMQAHFNIIRQLITRILGSKAYLLPLRNGVIYNRQAIHEEGINNSPTSIKTCYQIFIAQDPTEKSAFNYLNHKIERSTEALHTRFGISSFIIAVETSIILGFILNLNEIYTLIQFIVLAYAIISIAMQFRAKGYSLSDSLNLILFAPFGIFFKALIYVIGFSSLIIGRIIKRFNKLRRIV